MGTPWFQGPEYSVRVNNGGGGEAVFRMEGWKFTRLTTVPWAVLLFCANFLVIFTVFFLPIMCLPHKVRPDQPMNVCPIEPFSILIYVHVTYWVMHLIGDQILKKEHKKKRLQGYTEFYLETVRIVRMKSSGV